MFTEREKSFFIGIATAAADLSNSDKLKQGAVIVTPDKKINSYGYRIHPIESELWEISAIHNACSLGTTIPGNVLFSTDFPSREDIQQIILKGITTIYFLSEIGDSEAVRFRNHLKKTGYPLEIIQLQIK
jgi:deoxycytidylate deaminase